MILLLPQDAEVRAEQYPHLQTATKKQLLETIRRKTLDEQSQTLAGILRQSGATAEFFKFILGHETDARIPQNKKLNPIHTK